MFAMLLAVAYAGHDDNGLGYGSYSLHNGGYATGIGSYGGFGSHGVHGYRGAIHGHGHGGYGFGY